MRHAGAMHACACWAELLLIDLYMLMGMLVHCAGRHQRARAHTITTGAPMRHAVRPTQHISPLGKAR